MQWEVVIGLEVHVELSTKTKIFCSCTTEFGGAPNTHCCPICTGMPGTLPVLNGSVLKYAVKAGRALNCEINQLNKFDRKNYFYPDLPKAYQISQLYLPFAHDGKIELTTRSGLRKEVRIHEIHMEEDAGKLVHSAYGNVSYADYNRCGVPLIEIVSEPDFRSAEEVIAYLEYLRSTLKYLGVSDCKMQEGSMRADVNLSVRPAGSDTFGTRTEMKNINSLKSIEHAITFEAKRQIEVLESGKKVIQETRRWDDNKGKSFAMRSKENAQDYRYFPEPDIPPIYVDDDYLKQVDEERPEMAYERKKRYMAEFGLSEYDASIITSEKNLADLFEETVKLCQNPKEVCNWLMVQTMYFANEKNVDVDSIQIKPQVFADFIQVMVEGKLSNYTGKRVFEHVFDGEESFNVREYIKANDLEATSDDAAIREVVKKVIAENPDTVAQYKEGKEKVFAFLVGSCMSELDKKADPEVVNQLIKEELG